MRSKKVANTDLNKSLLSDHSEDGYKPTKVTDNDNNNNKHTIHNSTVEIEYNAIAAKPWYTNWKNWLKLTILVGVIAFLVIAIIYRDTTIDIFNDFLTWMQDNAAAGSFAFIGVYWFCTVFMIPGSILTLGAGYVFRSVLGQWAGIFIATIIVWIGATIGAATAFILGRFVLRAKVASYKQKYEKFDIIDQVVEKNGFKVTLLLRLSPIIPFNVFNYFMGLTSVTFKAYLFASIGMVPGTLAYCFIGATLSSLTDTASVGFSNPTVLIITIVGTVVALIGMIYMGYVAKKEFNKLAAEIQANKKSSSTPIEMNGVDGSNHTREISADEDSADLQYSNLEQDN